MPTNLKNLLSRSRSKNELKQQSQQQQQPTATPTSASSSASSDGVTPTTEAEEDTQFHVHRASTPLGTLGAAKSSQPVGPVNSLRRGPSSKSLHATFGSTVTPSTTTTMMKTTHTSAEMSHHMMNSKLGPAAENGYGYPSPTLRKSETMLTLTRVNSSSNNKGKTAGAVRDKILSASTQTLSSLFSTSTTKLFSGFKGLGMSHNNNNKASSGSRSQHSASIEDNLHEHERGGGQTPLVAAIPVGAAPLTPTNRLRKNWSANIITGAGSGSTTSLNSLLLTGGVGACPCCNGAAGAGGPMELVLCRLCLSRVKPHDTLQLQNCSCRFCKDCLEEYCSFEIHEGAYEIACPDADCPTGGILTFSEVESLVAESMMDKFKKFRLARDVDLDAHLCWCPVPGCETICHIEQILDSPPTSAGVGAKGSSSKVISLRVECPVCHTITCGRCRREFHHSQEPNCNEWKRQLIRDGKLSPDEDEETVFEKLGSIKSCPHCHIPIEKDSGCAQMMCKRCKHVFCWYCLQSLDDDFLLRHYDHGPCKNKLGHSRASIIWHRAQVIGIFAGFGILVVLASPLLILAAPCLLCCRCRYCSTKDLDGSTEAEVTLTSSSSTSQFQSASAL